MNSSFKASYASCGEKGDIGSNKRRGGEGRKLLRKDLRMAT